MSLTTDDLRAIKKLFDGSLDKRVPGIIDERMLKAIDERVPKIIDERVPKIIDERVPKIIDERVPGIVDRQIEKHMDQLRIEIGQFSLETTNRIDALDKKLSHKIDDLGDKLMETTEMADTNRVEIAKLKRKAGFA